MLCGGTAALCAACSRFPSPPAARSPIEQRGRHVLVMATSCGCHGPNFAGWKAGRPDNLPGSAPYGERFVGPFGVVPAANITQDPESGIGRWTDEQIARAIREGIRPDGSRLYPTMPYAAYHGMADSDMAALIAYLRRLTPVRNRVPPKELHQTPPPPEHQPPAPPRPPGNRLELGAYLVESVSGCGDCHTPKGPNGPRRELALAGNRLPMGPNRTELVPNITPDRETGIGRWSENDIAHYLRTGSRPDGGVAQGSMAGLILASFRHYTPEEARAVAAHLKSIPPIRNRP